MSDTFFCTALAILVPVLFAVLFILARMIADEYQRGDKCTGLAMIVSVAVIVVAALPWYLM